MHHCIKTSQLGSTRLMNYKNLRRKMRKEMYINISRLPELENRIRNLLEYSLTNVQLRALASLGSALEDLVGNAKAAIDADIERTVLIEKQIKRKIFEGELHENYHEKSQQLKTNYNNTVQSSKRLANVATQLLKSLYPEKDMRGLRFSSFGKLYNSLKVHLQSVEKSNLPSIFEKVTKLGDLTEETVHKYRDEVLEHSDPTGPINHLSIVTRDGKVEVEKNFERETKGLLPEIEFDQTMTNYIYQTIEDNNGVEIGHKYILHTYLRTDLSEGDNINEGDPIAYITDMGSGHFKKYGAHTHIFSFPDEDFNSKLLGSETDFEMPQVSVLTEPYLDLVDKLLDEVELVAKSS